MLVITVAMRFPSSVELQCRDLPVQRKRRCNRGRRIVGAALAVTPSQALRKATTAALRSTASQRLPTAVSIRSMMLP